MQNLDTSHKTWYLSDAWTTAVSRGIFEQYGWFTWEVLQSNKDKGLE